MNALPAALLAQADSASFWLPARYSHLAEQVDWIFWYVMWVSIVFFVGIVGVMLYFCYRYPRKKGSHPSLVSGPTHNTALEIWWSVIPMILVTYMFWVGLEHYVVMATAPADAYTIDVKAQKWNWTFIYPSGMEADTLHVPKGERIRLRMTSADVLHAFHCPVLRVKMDIIPGRTTQVWFIPTVATGPKGAIKEDDHKLILEDGSEKAPPRIFCAEYCGTDHSSMLSKLFVHEDREDYDAWLATYGPSENFDEPWEKGYWFYEKKGCKTCHLLTMDPKTGPGWLETSQNLRQGRSRKLATDESVKVTREFLRTSIKLPRAQQADGYPNSMPSTRLEEEDINNIIDFIEKLSEPEFKLPTFAAVKEGTN